MDGRRSRKGFIAVTALLIMAILLLVGVAFLTNATTENTMVVNEINGQVAFNIAEAGIDHAKRVLLGSDLTTVLQNGGILTFGASVSFANGTYEVKVTNNCTASGCTAVPSIPADPGGATTDTDSRVVIDSKGTYRNAIKIVRAVVEVPAIIPPSSIYTLNGVQGGNDPTDFNFNGNSFLVQGRDTAPGQTTPIPGGAAVPGEGVMPCSTCNPGHTPLQDANSALNGQQTNNITGATPNPSIAVVTSSITASSLTTLKSNLTAHANLTCSGGTSMSSNTPPPNCSGSNSSLGTTANPQITVVNGTLDLQGPVNGAGILLVTGHFRMRGNATFQGIIIVDGDDGMVEFEGNGNTVWGSIIQINRSSSNSGETRLRIGGNAQIYYSRQAIQDYGGGSLSATTLAWSERT